MLVVGIMAAPCSLHSQTSVVVARADYAARTLAGDSIHIGAAEPLTLVNVFATWCRSCKTEFADLESLAHAFPSRRFRVVAVSVDEGASARVRRFVEERHTTFPVVHDSSGRVTRVFRTVGVPESYLVNGDGQVVWHRGGELRGVMPALRQRIAKALERGP
jgi:thiol-disulfide isomerase/thioredoxin